MRSLPIVLPLSLAASISIGLVACSSSEDGAAIDPSGPPQESELREDGGRDGEAGAATTFTDSRDGKTYPLFTVGGKTWLAKNLDFAIPGSSWCYGDNPANCVTDGRLYTFQAAKTACPQGFHLGTDDDWKALESALGMRPDQLNLEGYGTVRGTDEGTDLKRADGFNVKPAGYRGGNQYDARGNRSYFWTASTRGQDVWRRKVSVAEPTVFRFTNPPNGFAISVRCAKD